MLIIPGHKGNANQNHINISVRIVKSLWKAVWRLLKKLKIDLPYDSAIPLIGICPKEFESAYNKGTCTPMFIAALFTIDKLWKQPRCLTNNEWIKKIRYLYIIKKN
jgi:hypothetical protein